MTVESRKFCWKKVNNLARLKMNRLLPVPLHDEKFKIMRNLVETKIETTKGGKSMDFVRAF